MREAPSRPQRPHSQTTVRHALTDCLKSLARRFLQACYGCIKGQLQSPLWTSIPKFSAHECRHRWSCCRVCETSHLPRLCSHRFRTRRTHRQIISAVHLSERLTTSLERTSFAGQRAQYYPYPYTPNPKTRTKQGLV